MGIFRRSAVALLVFPAVWMTFAFLIGCADQAPEWAGTIQEADGVVRIENPAEPMAKAGEVALHQLWVQSGPASGAIWEVPRKVHVHRGVAYLPDRQASRVHRVTTEGNLMASLGEPGAGPGQYNRIIDAIPTEAGLFVVDAGNARVEVLDSSGTRTASHPTGQVVFVASRLGDSAITMFGVAERETRWVSLHADGTGGPHDFPDFPLGEGEDVPISFATTWGDKLVRLRYLSPGIRIYTPEGGLDREIRIPLPPELATDAEVEAIVQEVSSVLVRDGLPSGVIREQVERIRARPREKSRFRKVVFDDESGLAAVWAQDPEEFGARNATLHLLSLDGLYLSALTFDHPWRDFTLRDGVLYVLSRDPDTDLATLQANDLLIAPGLLDRARRAYRNRLASREELPIR